MASVKFAGKVIVLGNVEYVVPAIAFRELKKLLPRLQKLNVLEGGMPNAEDLDTITEMAHAAIQRNYPEVTLDELDGVLDMRNLREVVLTVMGQTGLEPAGKPELTQASP
jgi:hypothetical protein